MWPCDLLNLNWLDGVGLFIQYEDRESREGLIWQSFYDRKLTETSSQPIRKIIWSELLIRRNIFSLIATFSNHSKKTFVFWFSLRHLVYRGLGASILYSWSRYYLAIFLGLVWLEYPLDICQVLQFWKLQPIFFYFVIISLGGSCPSNVFLWKGGLGHRQC